MCGTAVGNAISSAPAQPSAPQQPYQQPSPQPSPPGVEQPGYPNQTNFRVEEQRVPYVQPQPSYTPPRQTFPLLKLIHSSGREYRLAGEAGYIGRCSQSMTLPPEIDLTGIPHEGVISRRHARVYWDWSQNAYMIVDMSTNGIYLNGNILTPGVQYRLFNGDSLKLGQDNLINFQVVLM